MNQPPGRLARPAQRLHCTEGQLYTMAIGLVVAISLSAAGLPAAFRDIARPLFDVVAPASAPSASATTIPSVPTGPPAGGRAERDAGTTTPADAALPPLKAPGPREPAGGAAAPLPAAPAPAPCQSQATIDTASKLLAQLDVLNVLPDTAVSLLLANLTGCRPGDPTLLVLGVLAEFGRKLPRLGFVLPPLPLPAIPIPAPIVSAVQPLRSAIDPICKTVGSLSTVVFYGLAGWPLAIQTTTLHAINEVLLVCGQLQTPSSR